MKLVRMYWNFAAGLGTLVIILYVGQSILEAAQWVATLLQGVAPQ